MRNNKVWIIWSGLVVFGLAFSLFDYKSWKKAETEKFGQGWKGQEKVAEIAPLIGPYVNKVWSARIKYPKDWTIKENMDYSESNLYKKPLPAVNQREQIVEFSNPTNSISINVLGEVMPNDDLVDIVTKEAVGIAEDREYKNSDRAKFIVVHWKSPSEVKYKAYAKNSEVVYILESKSSLMEASLMQKTLMAVLEAFVPI